MLNLCFLVFSIAVLIFYRRKDKKKFNDPYDFSWATGFSFVAVISFCLVIGLCLGVNVNGTRNLFAEREKIITMEKSYGELQKLYSTNTKTIDLANNEYSKTLIESMRALADAKAEYVNNLTKYQYELKHNWLFFNIGKDKSFGRL